MSTFIQAHFLTAYPASNLNRDDTGRPKTMIYGGGERLRISSQSLKRALRTSPIFAGNLKDHLATRSQLFGGVLEDTLKQAPHKLPPEDATKLARAIIEHLKLGKIKAGSQTEQLVFLAPEEIEALKEAAATAVKSGVSEIESSKILSATPKAADIAMFGRMLAEDPAHDVEAAVQIAHAFTTHRCTVEDDYFTAVDDLSRRDGEVRQGSAFLGVAEYGSGLFYLYACINASLLLHNLAGDASLAEKTAATLIETLAKTAPGGKQNSFASRAYALYGLVETGPQQPRSLAPAFMRPVSASENDANDLFAASVKRIETMHDAFAKAYGPGANARQSFNVPDGAGSLDALVKLAASAAKQAEPLKVDADAA